MAQRQERRQREGEEGGCEQPVDGRWRGGLLRELSQRVAGEITRARASRSSVPELSRISHQTPKRPRCSDICGVWAFTVRVSHSSQEVADAIVCAVLPSRRGLCMHSSTPPRSAILEQRARWEPTAIHSFVQIEEHSSAAYMCGAFLLSYNP